MNEHTERCHNCGSADRKYLFSGPDRQMDLPGLFTFVECCYGHFKASLTREQVLALADELREIANQTKLTCAGSRPAMGPRNMNAKSGPKAMIAPMMFLQTILNAPLGGVARLERMPDEEPRGLAILALGKLGSRELNYSSDVDLILLFDPATLPKRPRDEPGEAAVRYGRRFIELMQQRTHDGYVARVDLRLRPSSEVTPIVLPVGAAISPRS